ncbi:YHS domain-containing (seleno)protein [Cerasicoccus frondis]|uniref:YHS domain-containing (seleno)protein n=1 Tax=Cerasicoccus frondis TaxID=490090 RepID=UPI0028525834|nr:YHS domain-containing (seleno)protein [Cerasicoccus frondis]
MIKFQFLVFVFSLAFVAGLACAAPDSALQSNSAAQSNWAPVKRQADFNLDSGDLGAQGYDPVSYFSNHPQKGNARIASVYRGVTYYFVNTANKQIFDADPGKYEPAFGGWCAWAMADDGSKVDVDPKTFKIVEGRLYLFYNGFWGDTLKKWNAGNQDALAKSAQANWASVTQND